MCVHRETGAQRAVKVLRKSHMDEDEKKMLFNEINILRELVSPKITNSKLGFPLLLFESPPYLIMTNKPRIFYNNKLMLIKLIGPP